MKSKPKAMGLHMLLIFALALSTTYCAAPQTPPANPESSAADTAVVPLSFDRAMDSLAKSILEQIQKNSNPGETVRIVMEPFRNRKTHEVPNVARAIEAHFKKGIADRKPEIRLMRLNRSSLKQAAYLVEGDIALHIPQADGAGEPDHFYRISARVVDLKKRKAMPQLSALVSDPELDSAPIALYRDAPLFFNQWRKDHTSETPALHNEPMDARYLEHLMVRALMAEAETAYDAGKYEQALALFRTAEAKDRKKILPVYSGIYAASLKMGDMKAAEEAFGKIVRLSVERYDMITVKFLFAVNTADFYGGEKQQKIYEMWLRQIGNYFQKTNRCFEIVGHTSPTGPESWNDQLSFLRAKNVQALLKKSFPGVEFRSRTIGRGFRDNIIGIGTDDARDLLDRRVEILPVPCEVEG